MHQKQGEELIKDLARDMGDIERRSKEKIYQWLVQNFKIWHH